MSASVPVFQFGPFRFDAATRVLWREADPLPVPPKALDLLAALLASAGEVVPKAELLRRAWPDVVVEEANLSVNVSILRRALGRGPGGRPWIETVARRGYRFAGPVAAAPRRPRALAVLPFRPLGSGGGGESGAGYPNRRGSTEPEAMAIRMPCGAGEPPPLERGGGFTPAPGDEALGLAMADALITRLGAAGRVEVRPTSAIQRYAHAEAEPREAGRALGVDTVLDGRLQRAGSRLRVTAQLLSVDGGAPLWADRFEADVTDLFAVQDTVAERLAEALALELGGEAGGPRGARQTLSLPAYEAYVRGRYFWTRFSRTWLEKAVACFHEAAELDPDYAAPHAGLADAILAAGFTGALAPREAWDLAQAEAERATARDDRLAEAHVSSAWVRLVRDWDWAAAEAGFRRAAERGSDSPAAHQWLGLFLALAGRLDEAGRELARARALDPLSLVASAVEGFRLGLAGDHAGALVQQRRTHELDPHQFLGRWALGTALQNLGRHEEAVADHRAALELAEGAAMMRPVLARSLALAGARDEARALLADRDDSLHVSPYQEATVHLALGEREAALERLHQACEARDPWAVLLPADPMLVPLHAEPAFRALAQRVRH